MLSIDWNKHTTEDSVKLADCIELSLVLDDGYSDGAFGYDDFIDRIRDEPYDLPDADEVPGFLDGDEADEAKIYFESAMALISQRRQWLGELYPFVGNGNEVEFTPATDEAVWMPYIYLLACANHTWVAYGDRKFTTGFEVVSKVAMKSIFNENADVFLFSQFSQDRAQMGLSARDAIIEICNKLHAPVVHEDKIPTTRQEFGIDIIAIDAGEDPLSLPFAAFAQCTIGKNWEAKRHEGHPRNRLSAYVHLTADYSNLLFIPHLPRLESGEWDAYPHETINCLLRDRFSICKMLERSRDSAYPTAGEEAAAIIEEFYQYCA